MSRSAFSRFTAGFSFGKKLDTRTTLQLMRQEIGKRLFINRSKVSIEPSANDVTGEVEKRQDDKSISSASVIIYDDHERIINDDPWRTRIYKRGMKKWKMIINRIKRAAAFIFKVFARNGLPLKYKIDMLIARREFTSMELSEIRDTEEQKFLDRKHQRDAQIAADIIRGTLTRLGFAHKPESKGRTQQIHFDVVKFDQHVYRFHVDAAKLPYKVDLLELASPRATTTLAGALGRPVSALLGDLGEKNISQVSDYQGLWYEVEIAGTLGIPNRCEFWKMLEMIPDGAHALAFTLGYAENKRPIVRSLEPLPHLLITGETLGGKSNGVNVIICCHISRNSADDLRTLMIDVKGGGIELGHFEGIKHMITEVPGVPNGIARTSEQGLSVLEWVADESEKRMVEFTAHKMKKLSQWNKKYPRRKKPFIVVYIDEVAELLDPEDRKLRKDVLHLIRKLASTSRAAGVHLVGALQTADRTNMPQTIKNNFPGRLAFAMADASASILAIGDGSAVNLSPVGRAIWKHGRDRVTIQTPFISNGDVDQIVTSAKEGKVGKAIKRSKVTPEEIIQWAIEENNNSLRKTEIFNMFGDRITQNDLLSILKDMEERTYEIDDQTYIIKRGIGARPRTVEKIGETVTDGAIPQTTPQSTTYTHNEETTEEA